MAGKRRWLSMKSRKVRFCLRDPCTTYPEEYRTMCWNEHAVENADDAFRKLNRTREESRSDNGD